MRKTETYLHQYTEEQIKIFLLVLESILRGADEGTFILNNYRATLKITECEPVIEH